MITEYRYYQMQNWRYKGADDKPNQTNGLQAVESISTRNAQEREYTH